MRGTTVRALAVVVVATVLVACDSTDAEVPDVSQRTITESHAPDIGQQESADPAALARTCPRLDHAEPRTDGLPDLELPCLADGPAVNLADLRGVPTVVNVWAAWCVNCDREMPLLADAAAQAGDRIRFFGIHYKAPREYGLRSEVDFGVPFPSVHDENGDRVVAALRATAPPQTFFVTADGRLAGRKIGEIRSAEELSNLIEQHLGIAL